MKHLLIFFLLLFGLQACTQKQPKKMTDQLWQEDLNYLNRKIQKQFNSFSPGVKETFDAEIKALEQKISNVESHQIYCEIMRILSLLKDGHTELNVGQKNTGFHRLPLSTYFFEDTLYILAAHEPYQELVGGYVSKLGKYELSEAFEKLKKTMSHDNDMEFIHAGPGYLMLTELLNCLGISDDLNSVSLEITLPDGTAKTMTFSGLDVESYNSGPWVNYYGIHNIERPLYLTNRESSYWTKYFQEEKTYYFHISRINNQKGQPGVKKFIRNMFDEIDQLKPNKLIIDFRLNNGGNYNLSRPLVDGIKARPWLNVEDKVWAITGRRTFSAASSTCIFLKQETKTKLIGEDGRTHPNLADNNEYMTLPNSALLIEYTTRVKKKWPERPDLDRIPVDIKMAPTFTAYKQGRDMSMEFILRK